MSIIYQTGLWVTDLSITQIMQERVEEEKRGKNETLLTLACSKINRKIYKTF